MKRNIREELKKISGGEFNSWYQSLNNEEKLEYNFMMEKYKNPTPIKYVSEEIDLGDAVNFWITSHGSLDLKISVGEILEFYQTNKTK